MEIEHMKTDAALQLDVIAELKWEPSVDAANVGVEVKDGIVTLAGHVDTYAEKWDAERAAQRVSGVKAIAVEMDVKLCGTNQRDDADIARSTANVLLWTTSVPSDSVKVKVEDGWLTLSGEVEWEYQRQSAANGVRYLMGVTGISDQIVIKPKVSSAAIRTDIEAALKRRAQTDARRISVAVNGQWSRSDLGRLRSKLVREGPRDALGVGHAGCSQRRRQHDRRVLDRQGFAGASPSRRITARDLK
jgi:osmotically-inducible protein OsmY